MSSPRNIATDTKSRAQCFRRFGKPIRKELIEGAANDHFLVFTVLMRFPVAEAEPAKFTPTVVTSHVITSAVLFNPSKAERTLFCLVLHEVLGITPSLGMPLAPHFIASFALVRKIIAVWAEFEVAGGACDFLDIAVDVQDETCRAAAVGTCAIVLDAFQGEAHDGRLVVRVRNRSNRLDVRFLQKAFAVHPRAFQRRFSKRALELQVIREAILAGKAWEPESAAVSMITVAAIPFPLFHVLIEPAMKGHELLFIVLACGCTNLACPSNAVRGSQSILSALQFHIHNVQHGHPKHVRNIFVNVIVKICSILKQRSNRIH